MFKIVCLIILVLSYYMAAMYANLPLIILCIAEFLFAAAMPVIVFYLKKHVTVRLPVNTYTAVQGQTMRFEIIFENSGKIPEGRVQLFLKAAYAYSEKTERFHLLCPNISEGGRTVIEAEAGRCGIIQMTLESIKVYDYTALFSRRKQINLSWSVAVFPRASTMQIQLQSLSGSGADMPLAVSLSMGNSGDEIRRIREYREGDSLKHIHWNETAKSGRPWVKEYEDEARAKVSLFLDYKGVSSSENMDSFYQLLWAILSGLLEHWIQVTVFWEKQNAQMPPSMLLTEKIQIEQLFLRLYTEDIRGSDWQRADQTLMRGYDINLRLTDALAWYANERLIEQFASDSLEKVLTSKFFII